MGSRAVVDKSGRGRSVQSLNRISKILHECQASGAQQSRIVTTLRSRNLHLLRRRAKRTLPNLPVHLLRKQVPTIHRTTSNHDDLGIDEINQVRQSDSQIHPKTLEHREREFVTITPRFIDLLSRQSLALQSRLRKRRQTLPRHAHDRRRRTKQFQTTSVTTLAFQPTERIDSRMPNLTSGSMRAAQ